MNDSVIKGTNNSKKIRATLPNTYAEFKAQMAMGKECDMMTNSAGYNQVGSAYSKANVLPDATCSALGIPTTSEPKDAFNQLNTKVTNAMGFTGYNTYNNAQTILPNQDLLYVALSDPLSVLNRPLAITSENSSQLVNSPVSSGAFYGLREIFFLKHPVVNVTRVLMRITEAYPNVGRIWTNVYSSNTSSWSGWKKIEPTT